MLIVNRAFGMRHLRLSICRVMSCAVAFCPTGVALADGPSTHPETGIGSQGLGLSGIDTRIGMVELHRPGSTPFVFPHDDTNHSNATVTPAAVYHLDGDAVQNFGVSNHPQHVAGIIISSHDVHKSVAPAAILYASAFLEGHPLVSMQKVAQHGASAINLSFGGPEVPNGNSLISLGLDWSANRHDVVYVATRGNDGVKLFVPADSFNGIAAIASMPQGGVFREVSHINILGDVVTTDGRRVGHLMAPGTSIVSTHLGTDKTGAPQFFPDTGTSQAAPHITGTVALLQQYSMQEGWSAISRRHEVMKVILLNSADKIKDGGDGRLLCMTRDARDPWSQPPKLWSQSDAYGPHTAHPFDGSMGVGHLNAKRAIKQFESGQQHHSLPTVPLVGWDYNSILFRSLNKYILDEPLRKNSHIAITLTWDRIVFCQNCPNGEYVDGTSSFSVPFGSGVANLDLYLMPKGATDFSEAVCSSTTTIYNIEHIFCEIPEAGEYEIWVRHNDTLFPDQEYALAWWAVRDPGDCPADLTGDGNVGVPDMTALLAAWGPDRCGHPADLNGDGAVGTPDMLILLASWGPCPGACCVKDFCSVVTKATCDSNEGDFLGPGTTCELDPCTPGACCIDEVCSSPMTHEECLAQNGFYVGNDLSCSPSICLDCHLEAVACNNSGSLWTECHMAKNIALGQGSSSFSFFHDGECYSVDTNATPVFDGLQSVIPVNVYDDCVSCEPCPDSETCETEYTVWVQCDFCMNENKDFRVIEGYLFEECSWGSEDWGHSCDSWWCGVFSIAVWLNSANEWILAISWGGDCTGNPASFIKKGGSCPVGTFTQVSGPSCTVSVTR